MHTILEVIPWDRVLTGAAAFSLMRLLYLVLVVKMLRLMLDEDMLSLALCCASLFERFTEDPCDLEGVQQHSTKCEKSDTQVRCKVLAIYRHRNHPVHASASGASVQGLSRRQISRATHASGASARLRFRTTSGTCSWSQAEVERGSCKALPPAPL